MVGSGLPVNTIIHSAYSPRGSFPHFPRAVIGMPEHRG